MRRQTMTFLQYESQYVCWRHYLVNDNVTLSHTVRVFIRQVWHQAHQSE